MSLTEPTARGRVVRNLIVLPASTGLLNRFRCAANRHKSLSLNLM
jgi:hypothetical protein